MTASTNELDSEIDREQSYIDTLYARLDQLRERTTADLATVRRTAPSGTHQNRSERDAFAMLHEARLAQLMAVEDRLAFGRLDLTSGARRYVGRLGLSDDEQTQLLVDWRAPAARSFYQATAASPGDVVRRRHLATRERTVVGVEDEVLDLEHMDGDERATLSGEGALLAAIGSARTGRMADIVATIQGEQDRVIRSDLAGVLVVQGGPGTGKTAVALHRAAYLLYTHRERLARSGVLVVGPNSLFLRYIEQVLPSLGETGVVMSTPGELYPGVEGADGESPEVAALKGDRRMARVVSRAVRDRQRVPAEARRLTVDSYVIWLRPEVVAAARGRARRTRKPHNAARGGYLKDLLGHLAGELAEAMRTELTQDNRADLLDELRDSADVRRELNLTWMPLTPEQLLRELFSSPEMLADCSPDLSPAERSLLLRDRSTPWTEADVPLLDEAAELLGEDDSAARLAARRRAAERAADVGYAEASLRSSGAESGLPQVTAEMLAGRFADSGPSLTVAERAESDRTWAFGHVVVDEAQELSPMMWRLLMRRCPTRSMTLVGDVAQVGSAAGTSSWGDALDPYVHDRWRLEPLTINYRTPAAIMRIASDVLSRRRSVGADAPVGPRGRRSPHRHRHPRGPRHGRTPSAGRRACRRRRGRWGRGRRPPGRDRPRGRRRHPACTLAPLARDRHRRPGPDRAGLPRRRTHRPRGQRPRVRLGRAGRTGHDPQGIAPRRQRPLRRPHPAHAAATGADQRRPAGRPRRAPPHVTTRVAVAAPNTASVEAATAVAALGGGAVDAAIAALLVAMVNEPGVVSIDAGAFVTVWPSGGAEAVTIDGCVAMPGLGRTADDSPPDVREIETTYGGGVTMTVGLGSVATPGALAALDLAHARFGRVPWAEVVAPAAAVAEAGFTLGAASGYYLPHVRDSVYAWDAETAAALHDPDGRWVEAGSHMRVAGLGDTLAVVAAEGARTLYAGALAEVVTADMAARGGLVTAADLASYRPIERPALAVRCGPWELRTNPPPAIGGAVLAALLTLLGDRPRAAWTDEDVALLTDAQRTVLGYRRDHLDVATDREAAGLGLLDLVAGGGGRSPSTVHVSVVDSTGSACAITASSGYGSGASVPGAGIWLNNCLGEHELNRGQPPRPGERLASNMAPTVGRSDDGGVLAIGSPGADRITTALAQVLAAFANGRHDARAGDQRAAPARQPPRRRRRAGAHRGGAGHGTARPRPPGPTPPPALHVLRRGVGDVPRPVRTARRCG